MATILAEARAAWQAGLCIVPPLEDGSKAPVCAWMEFREQRPSANLYREWYGPHTGAGVIAGSVSGGVECWDFDDLDAWHEYKTLAHETGLGDLVERIETGYSDTTPGEGIRWLLRCEGVTGDRQVLAARPGRDNEPKRKVLIELPTYAIVAPSNGTVHPSGKPYERMFGGFDTIVTITPEERDALIALARSLDQMPRADDGRERERQQSAERERQAGKLRPGDDYIARTTWPEVLEPHGWRHIRQLGEKGLWRRPGKEYGLSATTNHGGSDLLYVFSSSTEFDADRTYNRFGAYAVLHHGADFAAAARELGKQGYGDQSSKGQASDTTGETTGETDDASIAAVEMTASELLARVRSYQAPPMLVDGLVPGDGTTLLHAQPRHFKSFIALDVGIALTTGTRALGALDVSQPVPVLYCTNEDSWVLVGQRFEALLRARGLEDTPERFGFFIHAGVWLDEPRWRVYLRDRIRDAGYRVLVLDPMRSLTACVDQGPRELQPLAKTLRWLVDETGVVPVLSHHDTKPIVGQRDERVRPQRASGGGIFSIADAPVHCERIGDEPAVLVVPMLWKSMVTPPALQVRLTWDQDGARLTAEQTTAADAKTLELDGRILAYLREQVEASTNTIRQAIGVHQQTLKARLERLVQEGTLDSRPGKRGAIFWFLRETKP